MRVVWVGDGTEKRGPIAKDSKFKNIDGFYIVVIGSLVGPISGLPSKFEF